MTPRLSVANAAWLAGLWDGEGSVGVTKSRYTGRLNYVPQVQINMTDEATIDRVCELLRTADCHAIYHTVQEKMNHHKNSFHVGMTRTLLIKNLAAELIPYSVTKLPQWQLAQRLCELRIERQGLTPSGNLRRGGAPGWAKPYTDEEIEIAEQLCALNYRAKPSASGPIPRRPRVEEIAS